MTSRDITSDKFPFFLADKRVLVSQSRIFALNVLTLWRSIRTSSQAHSTRHHSTMEVAGATTARAEALKAKEDVLAASKAVDATLIRLVAVCADALTETAVSTRTRATIEAASIAVHDASKQLDMSFAIGWNSATDIGVFATEVFVASFPHLRRAAFASLSPAILGVCDRSVTW